MAAFFFLAPRQVASAPRQVASAVHSMDGNVIWLEICPEPVGNRIELCSTPLASVTPDSQDSFPFQSKAETHAFSAFSREHHLQDKLQCNSLAGKEAT